MVYPFLAQENVIRTVTSFIERVMDRPWVTFAELALISVVVYTALRFLHGTRGARLVRAVLILLAVSFATVRLLAERYELDRIKELYPFFIMSVFLVSLVAFQTELRRMLLRLGEGSWFASWSRNTEQVIEPIVSAVERLSKSKIGALIAIERSVEVGALIESGVKMDAVVSSELIETIFWPGTPLHDLGVIIHGGTISAAGCQFPLTESGEVERSLGSRHRAAVGMSQEADAVVIVVSEETGTISLATHGRLRRALTPASLREVLHKELITEKAGAGRLRKKTKPKAIPKPSEPAPTSTATPATTEAKSDGRA